MAGRGKKTKAVEPPEPEPLIDPGGELLQELENVRLQVFLDREMFSPGMIDGKVGATLARICEIYQRMHPDAADSSKLKAKAEAGLKDPYTKYVLRAEDFKFIRISKIEPVAPRSGKSSATGKKNAKMDIPAPKVTTIDDLVAEDFLGYTTARHQYPGENEARRHRRTAPRQLGHRPGGAPDACRDDAAVEGAVVGGRFKNL